MIKKLLLAGIMTAMVLSGCSSSDDKKEENTNTTQNEENTSSDPDAEYEALKEKLLGGAGDKFPQLEEPKEGEEIAIVKTNMGDIKIKLCPEEAPKAVENFVTHAKEGYYDGLTIHRVVKDFVIQGGDPAGNGTGGESIWGEPFEDEFSQDMYHFNGAVAMANSGANTNGSQFYIVARPTMLDGYFEYVDSVTEENGDSELLVNPSTNKIFRFNYSEEARNKYNELGGTPELDYGYSVFGQVFEGLDIVNVINSVEVDENDKPVTDVVIETIEIVKYSK
ncbi:hypothetical protein B5E58_08140 [Tyzzerella sp. An114]|uniref:peptidylprolyl isomerase n=1 Tax=Tyzzerella sp. An114 TaxID=1965545 RepID=UPI000B438F93|nr:peptidylprolyl isomerase [Tyzzerella sp. An114]OUQ57914.1 hypothetical protein B5E58_08140 [Tyzzerella sp. An114]